MDNSNDSEITKPVPGLQMRELDGLGFFESGYVVDGIYQIIDVIGSGGAGIVYRAEHIMLNQQHALKVLLPAAHTAENWRRFEQEARALAKLDHASIVKVFNMGFDSNRYPYFSMELVDGISLSDYLQQHGKLAPEAAVEVFLQLTDALRQAHKLGIVHRDIKPGNIMLLEKGKGAGGRPAAYAVKLLDFGIARLVDDRKAQEKTTAGAVFGTPLYMSPEQGRGEPVDSRSDLYSLGCAFFETLTGRPPFHGGSILETIDLHQRGQLPSLGSAGLVSDLTDELDICMQRLLAKEPQRRYQSAEQFAHDLLRIKDGKSVSPSILGSFDKSLSFLVTGSGDAQGMRVRLITLAVVLVMALGLIASLISSASKTGEPIRAETNLTNPLNLNQSEHLKQSENLNQSEHLNQSENLKQSEHLHQSENLNQSESLHQAAVPSRKGRYYKGIVSEGGRKYYHFLFPDNDAYVGKLAVFGGGAAKFPIGEVKLPAEGSLLVWLSNGGEDGLEDARCYTGSPIHGLTVSDVDVARLVEIIRPWKELTYLRIRTAGLTAADVDALSTMTRLEGFSLENLERRKGDVDVAALAKSSLLGRLNVLELSQLQSVQPLLPSLRKSRTIERLHIVGCQLSERDLKEILKSPGLKCLDIDQREMPAAQTLKALQGSKLKKLRLIVGGWTKADEAALKSINSGYVYLPWKERNDSSPYLN